MWIFAGGLRRHDANVMSMYAFVTGQQQAASVQPSCSLFNKQFLIRLEWKSWSVISSILWMAGRAIGTGKLLINKLINLMELRYASNFGGRQINQ